MNKEEDINDVISEIFKERPELLNNTTSLFELVMKIADERDKYKNNIDKAIHFIEDNNNYFEDGETWQNILKIQNILKGDVK